MLEDGWTLRQAAEAAGCSVRTAAKWLARYRNGDHELLDRSSRPRCSPRRLAAERVEAIERLRRVRMTAAPHDRQPRKPAAPLGWRQTRQTQRDHRLGVRTYLRELGLRHLRIKPRRPRTNGKAERLIQTLLNEWAYSRIYGSSTERTTTLPLHLNRYN